MKKRQHKTNIMSTQSVTNDTQSAHRLNFSTASYVYRLNKRRKDWFMYGATFNTRYIRMNCEE